MIGALDLATRRLDVTGQLVRQKIVLDLVSETLVGDLDDQAPDWWRDRADRFDELGEPETADRFRSIAALVEEANL